MTVLAHRERLPAWVASLALVAGLHALAWRLLCQTQAEPPAIAAEIKNATAVDMAPPPAPAVQPPPPAIIPPPPVPQLVTPPVPAASDPLPIPRRQHLRPPHPQLPAKTPAVVNAAPVAAATPSIVAPPPSASAVENWQGRLRAKLLRFRVYPPAAEARDEQGTALMRVTIGPNGEILSMALAKTSGSAALDADASAWMQRAAPLPAPPQNMPVTIIMPLRYHLDDD